MILYWLLPHIFLILIGVYLNAYAPSANSAVVPNSTKQYKQIPLKKIKKGIKKYRNITTCNVSVRNINIYVYDGVDSVDRKGVYSSSYIG
jgi:hypothetical protein